MLGQTLFTLGELAEARQHLETAISLYDRDFPPAFGYLTDGGVVALSYSSWTLWYLGYPDLGLKRARESVALARALSHPFSLAFAEYFLGFLYQRRDEPAPAEGTGDELLTHSLEHGLTDWLAWATILRGWAIARLGRSAEGIERIKEGLAASGLAGAALNLPYFLTLLAEALSQANRVDEALNALKDALLTAERNEDRHYESGIYRLRGELLLRRDGPNSAEARQSLNCAVAIARKQGARSLELRATTSLVRLLVKQGRRDEAHAMLAKIYNWFTEGFDTADLREARALLQELEK
jgi:predicted ATPase